MPAIRDIFFQVVILLLGAIIGVVAQMLGKSSLQKLLALLSGLLIFTAVAWIGYELYNRPNIPSPIPTATQRIVSTPSPIATLTLSETIIEADGHIYEGIGNQWGFSTDSSEITIGIDLTEPAGDCPIEVWVVKDASNQIVFTDAIASGALKYTTRVTLETSGNYTVVVGGNDRRSSIPGCSGTENYFFKIKVTS